MNTDQQEPPPSYTEAVEKLVHYPDNDRAATYVVPAPVYAGNVRYTAYNQTTPNTYGVQIVPMVELRSEPIQCICTKCHSTIVTHTERRPGLIVWLVSCILILFGCWFGCCLIPFCIPGIQNTKHYCPNCKTFIGKYRLL